MPLFVKAPGQMEPHVNRAAVRNIDMLATIADLLGSRVFYEQDGRSAFSREVRARHEVEVRTRDFAGVVRIGLPELEERRESRRREHAEELGEGKESSLLYGDPWASAYRVGPHPELLGRARAPAPRERRPGGSVGAGDGRQPGALRARLAGRTGPCRPA